MTAQISAVRTIAPVPPNGECKNPLKRNPRNSASSPTGAATITATQSNGAIPAVRYICTITSGTSGRCKSIVTVSDKTTSPASAEHHRSAAPQGSGFTARYSFTEIPLRIQAKNQTNPTVPGVVANVANATNSPSVASS